MRERRPAFAGVAWRDIGERGALTAASAPASDGPARPQIAAGQATCNAVGYRQLMGAAVDHLPVLHFQRCGIEIAHDADESLGVATGDRVAVADDGHSVTGAGHRAAVPPGVVRLAAALPYIGPGASGRPQEPVMPDGFIVTAISRWSSTWRWCCSRS